MTIIKLPNGIYERYEYAPSIFNPTNYKIYQLGLSKARDNQKFDIKASQLMMLQTNGSFKIDLSEKGKLYSSDIEDKGILPIAFDSLKFSNSTQIGKVARFMMWLQD